MSKPQPTKLPNYQNYQNVTKVKMTKVANWKRRRTRSLYPPPRVPRFSNKLWLSKKRFKIRLTSKTLTAPCFSLKNMSPLRASSPMMLKLMTMTLMALTASLKLRADLLMVLVTHSLYSKFFFFFIFFGSVWLLGIRGKIQFCRRRLTKRMRECWRRF